MVSLEHIFLNLGLCNQFATCSAPVPLQNTDCSPTEHILVLDHTGNIGCYVASFFLQDCLQCSYSVAQYYFCFFGGMHNTTIARQKKLGSETAKWTLMFSGFSGFNTISFDLNPINILGTSPYYNFVVLW